MRNFLAFVILLCAFAGLWLLGGADFFMPARRDPSHGLHFGGLSSRLLGAALFLLAVLGVGASRQAASGRIPGRHWQWGYFLLFTLSLVLFFSALFSADPGPSPHHPPAGR